MWWENTKRLCGSGASFFLAEDFVTSMIGSEKNFDIIYDSTNFELRIMGTV
jgi:hypothetical protein